MDTGMNFNAAHLNLILAWLWIVLGFAVGFFLGLNFHKERWLGAYAGFRRRLYRLAHISFFGLAWVNFLFYLTARSFTHASIPVTVASWGFVLGVVTNRQFSARLGWTLFGHPLWMLTGSIGGEEIKISSPAEWFPDHSSQNLRSCAMKTMAERGVPARWPR